MSLISSVMNGHQDPNAKPKTASDDPGLVGGKPAGGDPGFANTNLPPMPTNFGGGADNGVTVVNTSAMRSLATNLDTITEWLKGPENDLGTVKVAPGTFPSAVKLAKAVNTDSSGLRDQTVASLKSMRLFLADVGAGLRQMAGYYDSAEDANKADADDFKKYLGNAQAQGGAIGDIDAH